MRKLVKYLIKLKNCLNLKNEFDNYLFENKLNPGTTADLTAASIMLSFLASEFDS